MRLVRLKSHFALHRHSLVDPLPRSLYKSSALCHHLSCHIRIIPVFLPAWLSYAPSRTTSSTWSSHTFFFTLLCYHPTQTVQFYLLSTLMATSPIRRCWILRIRSTSSAPTNAHGPTLAFLKSDNVTSPSGTCCTRKASTPSSQS